MKDVSFKPRLVSNEKNAAPRIVIRKGQPIALEAKAKSTHNSAASKSTKQITKDSINRLFQYGQQIKAKHSKLREIKDSLEGSQYNFQPEICRKSEYMVQDKQQKIL